MFSDPGATTNSTVGGSVAVWKDKSVSANNAQSSVVNAIPNSGYTTAPYYATSTSSTITYFVPGGNGSNAWIQGLTPGSTMTVTGITPSAFNITNATITSVTINGAGFSVIVTSSAASGLTVSSMTTGNYTVTNTQYPTMTTNAVSFNGTQFFSLTPSLLPFGTSNSTFFFVSTSSAATRQFAFCQGGNASSARGLGVGQTANTYYIIPGNTTGTYPTSPTLGLSSNQLISTTTNNQIVSGWSNGTSFTTNNNQDQQNLIANGLATGTVNAVIGMGFTYLTSPFPLIGTISEILVFNTALSNADRQLVEGYLAWKWGLQSNLLTTHPYYPAPTVVRPFSRNFVPTDINGCQVWLDPADSSTVTLTASKVTTILDKSGNSNNFTNASSTLTYTSTLNGLPVLTFTNGGATNQLNSANITRDPVNHSYFVVFKFGATGVGAQNRLIQYGTGEFLGLEGSSGTNTMYIENNNAITGGATASMFYGAGTTTLDAFYGSNTFVVGCVRQNGVWTFSTNGTPTTTQQLASVSNTSSGSQYYIFGGTIGSVMGDVIIYNAALTDVQRQQVEGYLLWKWGIRGGTTAVNAITPVLATHPFYKFPPPSLTPLLPKSQALTRPFFPYDLSPTIWMDSSDSTTYTVANNRVKTWTSKGTQALTFSTPNMPYTLIIGPQAPIIATIVSQTSFTMRTPVLGVGTMTGLTVTIGGVAITGCTLIGGSNVLTRASATPTISLSQTITMATYTVAIPSATTIATGGTAASFTMSAVATGTAGATVSGVPVFISGLSVPNCSVSVGSAVLTTPASTVVANGADVVVQPGPLVNTSPRGAGLGKSYFDFSPGGNIPLSTTITTSVFNPTAITVTAASVASDGTTIIISSSPSITFVANQQITFNGSGTVIPGTTPITAGTIYFVRTVYTIATTNINFPTNNITISATSGGTAITGLTAYTVLSGVTATTGAYTSTFGTSIAHKIPIGAPVVVVVDTIGGSTAAVGPANTGNLFGNIQSVPSTTSFTFLTTSANILTIPAGTTIPTGGTGTTFTMSAAPIGTGTLAGIAILIAGTSRTCTIVAGSTTLTISTSVTIANASTVAAGLYGYPNAFATTSIVGHVEYGNNPIIRGNVESDGVTVTLTTAMPHNLQVGYVIQPCIFGPGMPSQWIPYTSAIVNSNSESFTGYISAVTGTSGTTGVQLTVTAGKAPGVGAVLTGTGVTSGTVVSGIIVSGTSYYVNLSQAVAASTAFTSTYSTMTFVGGITGTALTYQSGTIPSVGMTLSGTNVLSGTYILSGTSPNFVVSQSHSTAVAAGTTIAGMNHSVELGFPSTNWPNLYQGFSGGSSFATTGVSTTTTVTLNVAVAVGTLIIVIVALGDVPAGAYYVASAVGTIVSLSSSRTLSPIVTFGVTPVPVTTVWTFSPFYRLGSAGTSTIVSLNNLAAGGACIVGIDAASRKITLTGWTGAQPTSGTVNMGLITNATLQPSGSGLAGSSYLNCVYSVASVPTPTTLTVVMSNYNVIAPYYGYPFSSPQVLSGVTYTGLMSNYGYLDFTYGGNTNGSFSVSTGGSTWTQANLLYPAVQYPLDAGTSPATSFGTTTTTVVYVEHSVYPAMRPASSNVSDTIVSTSVTAGAGGGNDTTSGGRDIAIRCFGASQGSRPSIHHNNADTSINNNSDMLSTVSYYRIFVATLNGTASAIGDVPALLKTITQNGWRNDGVSGTFGFNTTYFASTTIATAPTLAPTTMRIGSDTASTGYGICVPWGFIGGLAELMVFNAALTMEKRQMLEGYLSQKYCCQTFLGGTATSTTSFIHPYRLNPVVPSGSLTYYTGLTLWFDAADSSTLFQDVAATNPVTASGQSVQAWKDKSGNGVLATNASAAPTATLAAQNNNAVVSFASASSQFLTLSSTAVLPTGNPTISVFIVSSDASATGRGGIFQYGNCSGSYSGTGFQAFYNNAPNLSFANAYGGGAVGASGGTVNTYTVVSAVVGPPGTVNANGWRNGAIYTGQTNTQWTFNIAAGSTGYVGRYFNYNLYEYLNGTIAELMIFNGNMSTTQRQQVEGYLAWKWGLQASLPTTHAYYKVRP